MPITLTESTPTPIPPMTTIITTSFPTLTTPLSSSSSSPTPTQTYNDSFNATTSPPLILAVLSISLFACSMLGVFAWRRVQYARGLLPPLPPSREHGVMIWGGLGGGMGAGARRNGGGQQGLGETPKLWDLKTIFTGGGRKREKDYREVAGWDDIMPISVMITPDKNAGLSPEGAMGTNSNTANTPHAAFYAWFDAPILDNHFGCRHPREPDVEKKVLDTNAPPGTRMAERIQVAVAIAMPTLSDPHRPRGSTAVMNNDRDDDDWTRPVAYTLGFYDRPWKREDG